MLLGVILGTCIDLDLHEHRHNERIVEGDKGIRTCGHPCFTEGIPAFLAAKSCVNPNDGKCSLCTSIRRLLFETMLIILACAGCQQLLFQSGDRFVERPVSEVPIQSVKQLY